MSATRQVEEIPRESRQSELTQHTRRNSRSHVGVDRLDYHLFKPRSSKHALARAAYELWRDEWQATLRELEGVTRIHSDEFVRQDEISVLSSAGQCVSVTALRWLDLSRATAREDSYFQAWPEEALAELGTSIVAISSNTLVHPEWRGTRVEPPFPTHQPTPLSFVTVALAIRRFLDSKACAVIGVTRNDRSMNRVAAGVGARKIGQIKLHGIDSDLICIERAAASPSGPVMDAMWERRYQEE
jgi:hypothetical protein